MSVLVPVTYLTTSDDSAMSRITDLEIVRFGGVDSLVGITRFDGRLQSWDIGGPVLTGGAHLQLEGGDVAGGAGAIVTLDTATGPVVLIGGGAEGAFQQVALTGGQWQVTGTLPILAGFRPDVVMDQGDAQIVYGGLAGDTGIAAWRFNADGGFATVLPVTHTAGPVVAMTQAAGFVYTVDATNTLAGWQVDATGGLSQIAALTPATGL
ncbi:MULTISPECIES: hypothetical protein [unclassified Yoonia]|uniref:hypothetical protein n=1 Tax=unclassified Yoonia TaxID=2629118 RepID=UPI002AFE5984|nr:MULTISPECIES: hypothetical protein [unclassified Yoonia]